MVEDLLALATLLGAGILVVGLWRRGRTSPEYVSLSEVATAAWKERVAHESAATLEIGVEQDVAVYADPRELSGILTALLENAVEHGPADGTVRVDRTDDGFAVTDEGPGIPEPEREQVFEFGYSTRLDHDGLGLGLVYSVCESHDWTVRVEDSERGGAKIVIEGVDFLTDWDGDETTTPDPDDDTDRRVPPRGDDTDRRPADGDDDAEWGPLDGDDTERVDDDASYITGDVTDQSDTESRERAPADN